jgi:hypothetical protein
MFPPSHAGQIEFQRTPIRFALILLLCLGTHLLGCAEVRKSTLPCPTTVQAKISPTKPTVYVSYTEPSLTTGGGTLTSLVKTSIYYDLDNERSLAKEVPATHPSGGGEISETITVPTKTDTEQSVKICVTATDSNGNESASTR